MKNIIIVGYPKSGCTWLTRLTAELATCPVVGFWHSSHKEIATEKLTRKSEFRCFKAHHQLNNLGLDGEGNSPFIVYVIRDPRDIAVSGARYFNFTNKKLRKILGKIPCSGKLYRATIGKFIPSQQERLDRMIQDILYGKSIVGYWHGVSWKAHYEPYLDAGVLFVKYEDMLDFPDKECRRILEYIGVQRDEQFIKQAIYNQSFKKKKKDYFMKAQVKKAKFLKVGKSGQWIKKLSNEQKKIFVQALKKELELFSYEV